MSGKVIAICGKGGVGKTTVAAMLAKLISDRGAPRTLLVDADPLGGLSTALDIHPKSTVNDLRKATIAEVKRGTEKGDLAAAVDYRLMDSLVERGNLAFLSVGRPEELGCFCSVHSLLRQSIELLSEKFGLTIIDAEAGVEQVNRQVMGSVDLLLLVADSSLKSIRAVKTIEAAAKEVLAPKDVRLIFNRIQPGQKIDAPNIPLLATLLDSQTVREFDQAGRSFFEIDTDDISETKGILDAILN
jgi:CO dehydrogenase maturation factor